MPLPDLNVRFSISGVIKWVLNIAACGPLLKALHGLVYRRVGTGYGINDVGQVLTGDEAMRFGAINLGIGLLLLGTGWAVGVVWSGEKK